MSPFIADVILHAGIGTVFAGTGACVRGMCDHLHHKIILGGTFILAESAALVYFVG